MSIRHQTCPACGHILGLPGAVCQECGREPERYRLVGDRRRWRRLFAIAVGIVVIPLVPLAAESAPRLARQLTDPWSPWSSSRQLAANTEGRRVAILIDAEWALPGNMAEFAHARARLPAALKDSGFATLQLDVTKPNPVADSILRRAGDVTVPVVVILGLDGSLERAVDPAVLLRELQARQTPSP